MPEIRLGSVENFPNINLGAVELQEIWLGSTLVWQNNQGPIYMNLSWDGTSFSVPDPFEGFTGIASSFTGPFNGSSGARSISIVIDTISDPDNEDPTTDDYIVGFRLQRPDGSWAFGDPDSTANNSLGAPISEYGETLPGVTATYDAANDIFTAGLEDVPVSTIDVELRDIDSGGNTVDSPGGEFTDDGNWLLTVIDSRGGESDEVFMDITLSYQPVSPTITGDGTNFACGTGSTTLGYDNTGGPVSAQVWDGGAGINPTYAVAVPTFLAGSNTHSATITGRSSISNAASVSVLAAEVRERAPYTTPNVAPFTAGQSSSSTTVTAATSIPGCTGVPIPAHTTSFSFSGSRTGSGTGLSATYPAIGCVGTDTLESVIVTFSANNPAGSDSETSTFTASYPGATITCTGSGGTTANATLTGTVDTMPLDTTNCAGSFPAGTFPGEFTWTADVGYSFGGNPTATETATCSYGAGTLTGAGTATLSGIGGATATQGMVNIVCADTMGGAVPSCTVTATVPGVNIMSGGGVTTIPATCPAALTDSTYNATIGAITFDNGTTLPAQPATGNCLGLPAFTCADAGLNIPDGAVGAAVTGTAAMGTISSGFTPATYATGTNTYSADVTAPGGFAPGTISCSDDATGTLPDITVNLNAGAANANTFSDCVQFVADPGTTLSAPATTTFTAQLQGEATCSVSGTQMGLLNVTTATIGATQGNIISYTVCFGATPGLSLGETCSITINMVTNTQGGQTYVAGTGQTVGGIVVT